MRGINVSKIIKMHVANLSEYIYLEKAQIGKE